MPKQSDLDQVYMGAAILQSSLSKAVRKKVGAVLVTLDGVMIPGWNGTPVGDDNTCEDVIYDESGDRMDVTGKRYRLVTKSNVIHAEMNALIKCAKDGVSVKGATIYITLSPCEQCLSVLRNVGINRIVYLEPYLRTEHLNGASLLIDRLDSCVHFPQGLK